MRRLLVATALGVLGLTGPASAATSDVRVAGNAFSPSSVTVAPGDTVRWTFAGPDLNHSVTADTGQSESFDSDPGEPSPLHTPGDVFTHTFNSPGSFTYLCKVHSFMTGRVVVQVPGSAPPPDTTAPVASDLSVRGGRTRRPRRPTRVSFELSEPADVRLRFRRTRGSSPRPVSREGEAGANVVRLSTRRIPPGRYRLTLRATDAAGNRSAPAVTSFRVR